MTMTSYSAGHIILTPTQPVGSGRPQRESNPGSPHQESRALPTELPRTLLIGAVEHCTEKTGGLVLNYIVRRSGRGPSIKPTPILSDRRSIVYVKIAIACMLCSVNFDIVTLSDCAKSIGEYLNKDIKRRSF